MSQTTVFAAKDIITMNPSRPCATHVAVRDGRILAAGDLDEMSGWGPYELNDDFAGHDEDFLGGHGDIFPGPNCGECRLQSGSTDDGDQHDVRAGQCCQLDQSFLATGHADAIELCP